MSYRFGFLIFMVAACFASCHYIENINEPPVPTFTEIKGIKYSEAHRRFDNGLSFNEYGFQLEPEWHLYFNADDSVRIYSPERDQFMTYRIFHSHKALFHFARDWFRVRHVSKDSLILQVMRLEKRVVKDELSNVYMTLYADDYIKNVLKTTVEELRKPSKADTLFIKYRAIEAISNPDSAFAARNPVVMKSKSPILTVEKAPTQIDPNLDRYVRSDTYLQPRYNIHISKAYQDFDYTFSARVDHFGKMHFKQLLVAVDPEYKENKIRVVKGIIDVYLKNLMEITPGNTLGINHPSVVHVRVKGRM